MNTSTLNFTIISSPKTKYSDAQILLQEWTGKNFSRNEADIVWQNVVNHKWNTSEKLGRDIGLRVAAVDFIENFYQPKMEITQTNQTAREIKIPAILRRAIRFYFESKANSFQL